MKIVLDGFGGDNAPHEIVGGAIQAVNTFDDVKILLVGKEEVLKQELSDFGYEGSSIEILNANDVITNNEQPTVAIRTKKESSLVVALDYINENSEREDIAGFVSAGSTGAVLSGALFKLGRLQGIKRPALSPPMPNLKGGKTLIVDCGANVDSKPEFLVNFAIMGSIYMQTMFGVENPKVALLNVGTEDEKGNDLTHETFKLLKETKEINFVGNMEARDLLSGDYDVVVTDGFAGNVALKTAEGTGEFVLKSLKNGIKQGGFRAKLGAMLLKPTLNKIKNEIAYSNVGGSPFLGCKKIVIKAHGSSKAQSICSAISLCRNIYKAKFVEKLSDALAKIYD